MTSQRYFCTRPRLASLLISAGVHTVKTDNPFSDGTQHRKAWITDLTPLSARIIADFFAEQGKPAPAAVAAVLDGGACQ